VTVVKRKNDPRLLNSLACELDSIKLVNIEFSLAGACGSRELVLGNLDPILRGKFRVLSTEY
jgi:hypothetical protein